MLDTTLEGQARYADLLRAASPEARLAQALSLSQAVRDLAIAGIRNRFPSATAEEIRARLAVRLYGREIACRVYSNVPNDAI